MAWTIYGNIVERAKSVNGKLLLKSDIPKGKSLLNQFDWY